MRLLPLFALTLVAAPALADSAAPPTSDPAVSVPRARPAFKAEPFLIDAHLLAGIEPYGGSCSANESSTCRVAAFTVGGALLWRGILGPAVGLWASAGAPLVPANSGTDKAFGDRVSATLALGVRPLAHFAWRSGDGWLARFVSGIGVEVGASLEYLRTSSIPVEGCDIRPTKFQPGFHLAGHFDVSVLGDAQSGWLALRVMGRFLANAETPLAPNELCKPLVVMPAVTGQIVFGLAYSL